MRHAAAFTPAQKEDTSSQTSGAKQTHQAELPAAAVVDADELPDVAVKQRVALSGPGVENVHVA